MVVVVVLIVVAQVPFDYGRSGLSSTGIAAPIGGTRQSESIMQ